MAASNSSTKTRERVKVTISGDAMSATILLFKPHEGEQGITAQEIETAIEAVGITFGLNKTVVDSCIAEPQYNKPILIAEGVKPKKGEPSTFEYLFNISNQHLPTEDEDGRIDYRNINFIQNIEKDAPLVKKTPATPGIPGRTVRNKELKAPGGRDVPFNKGVNTAVSADELTLTATASGAIMYQHGKVSVNDLTVFSGDIDHQTGNIDCRGSVRVGGNVKAGYTLKVECDLEVGGHIEDASVEVGGSITVKGGFFGKGDSCMSAGGDITIKYAEGQKLVSGGSIYVGGEFINCDVLAKEEIIFKGSKGKIMGGEVKAGKRIQAAEIGSDTGTATHLYVAFDSKLMHEHAEVNTELERLAADKARVKEALYALYKLELAGKLPPEKKKAMTQLNDFQSGLPAEIEALESKKAEIEAKLREYDDSCVVAERMLYNGVTVHFGVVYKDIVDDHEACRLTIEGGKILMERNVKE